MRTCKWVFAPVPLITVFKSRTCMLQKTHNFCAETITHSTYEAFAARLRSCGSSWSLCDGQQIHGSIVSHGYEQEPFFGNLVVQMYARCLDLDSANFCFEWILEKNVFTYNFLIGGYDGIQMYNNILLLFEQMHAESIFPDKVTYVHVLSAYANIDGKLCEGKQLNLRILAMSLDSNFIVMTALLNMYAKYDKLDLALGTFRRIPECDVASWNAMIAVYMQQGHHKEALQTFEQLYQECFLADKITFVNTLCGFSAPGMLVHGKRIHASLQSEELSRNVVVATALMNMYGKCGSLNCSKKLFDNMLLRNLVTWNALITLYAQNGSGLEALGLLSQMHREGINPNKVTYVSILEACANEGRLEDGRIVHALMTKYAYELDVIVGTAIVNMYNNCSLLEDGKSVFESLPERNIISWNAMMTGFVHHGYGKEALQLFDQMQKECIMLDELTTLAVLSACALEVSLMRGKIMHNEVTKKGFDLDILVANNLLNMYGKCGYVGEAKSIFEKMPEKSLVSWNSMIALHAQHGNGSDVIELFCHMQSQSMTPNETTVSNVFALCSHAGLVTECVQFISDISQVRGILPLDDHFDAVVDMLGRAGRLDEAEFLISSMPIQPGALSWTTLLSACRNANDVIRGQAAGKHSIEMDFSDEVTYVTLSNIYAAEVLKRDELLGFDDPHDVHRQYMILTK